jgi:hypothetical protein
MIANNDNLWLSLWASGDRAKIWDARLRMTALKKRQRAAAVQVAVAFASAPREGASFWTAAPRAAFSRRIHGNRNFIFCPSLIRALGVTPKAARETRALPGPLEQNAVGVQGIQSIQNSKEPLNFLQSVYF